MASLSPRALPAGKGEEIIAVLDSVMQARKIWDTR
jgi:hypothetical protein